MIVSHRGEPVVQIAPVTKPKTSLEERMAELERKGVLIPARGPKSGFKPSGHRPGALQRFLDERCGDEAVPIQ